MPAGQCPSLGNWAFRISKDQSLPPLPTISLPDLPAHPAISIAFASRLVGVPSLQLHPLNPAPTPVRVPPPISSKTSTLFPIQARENHPSESSDLTLLSPVTSQIRT